MCAVFLLIAIGYLVAVAVFCGNYSSVHTRKVLVIIGFDPVNPVSLKRGMADNVGSKRILGIDTVSGRFTPYAVHRKLGELFFHRIRNRLIHLSLYYLIS